MLSGKKFPKMIGIDFSGLVHKVGKQNNMFNVGDEIFGAVSKPMTEGALAEFIAVKLSQITAKPSNISFEEASAMTSAGAVSIIAFEEKTQIKKGQHILINGASGGTGMIAIQVAKKAGATVTAVSSTDGLVFTKQWGADYVLDYKKENVYKLEKKFDIILDLAGNLSFIQAKVLMTQDAIFFTPMGAEPMKDVLFGVINSLFSKQKFYALIAPASIKIRERLSSYAKDGLIIHISEKFSLDSYNTAYATIPSKSIIGKAVISI